MLQESLKEQNGRVVSETSKLREEIALLRAQTQQSDAQLNARLGQARKEGEAAGWDRAVDESEKTSYRVQQVVQREHLRYVEQVRKEAYEKGFKDGCTGNRPPEPPPLHEPSPLDQPPPSNRHVDPVAARNSNAETNFQKQNPVTPPNEKQAAQRPHPVETQQPRPHQTASVTSLRTEGRRLAIPSTAVQQSSPDTGRKVSKISLSHS
jgi:hypothetical protein